MMRSLLVLVLGCFLFHTGVNAYAPGDVEVIASGAVWGAALCHSTSMVYFTHDDNRIRSVSTSGGTVTLIDNGASGSGLRGITCMQSTRMLYFASVYSGQVFSVQDTGGTPSAIASIPVAHGVYAHTDGKVYVRTNTINDNKIYIIDTLDSNAVTWITVSGMTGAGVNVVINPVTSALYATSWQDGGYVFHYDAGVSSANGQTMSIYSGLGNPSQVMTDPTGTYLYVADWDSKLFYELRASDGARVNTITPSSSIGSIEIPSAIHDGWMYFASYNDATLYRIYTRAPATISGDPQFVGFQQQSFQVHGTAGEIFNLISSPLFHVNSRFQYLNDDMIKSRRNKHGACHHHTDICYTHEGTYLDTLGILMRNNGQDQPVYMRLDIVDEMDSRSRPSIRMSWGQSSHDLSQTYEWNGNITTWAITNTTLSPINDPMDTSYYIQFRAPHEIHIHHAEHLSLTITVSSDGFFNLGASLLNTRLLHHGRIPTVVNGRLDTSEMYPRYPLHGLIGQTWKNIQYRQKQMYEGQIDDYMSPTQELLGYDVVFQQWEQ